MLFFFLLQKKQQRTINMITATTSIPKTKPTIKPILLFGSVNKTPSFVVSSLTDAVVVTFIVDEVMVVDVTGIVAVVLFGSLLVVVAAASIVVDCSVTGDNDNEDDLDVDVFLIVSCFQAKQWLPEQWYLFYLTVLLEQFLW